jgi:hypothetical protein
VRGPRDGEQVVGGDGHVVALAVDLVGAGHVGVEHLLREGDEPGVGHPGAVVSVGHLAELVGAHLGHHRGLAASSSLMGMKAAMPPIACTPRRWQVLMARRE